MSLAQCESLLIKRMVEDGVLQDNAKPRVVESLVVEQDQANFADLKVLDIDVQQAEYLQTIGDGWAFPLRRFMNEMELLESMHMKTVTDANGQKHLMSVPITQHLTTEQKDALANEKKIALKCTKLSDDVLAVINNPCFFENRKEEISARTFGCMSEKHPKAAVIFDQGDWLVSGESMDFVKRVTFNDGMDNYRMTPKQIHE